MKTKIYSFLFGAIFLLSPYFSAAQSAYRWCTGGGSPQLMTLSRDWEDVHYMCTDQNRNMYALSIVGDAHVTADTFHRAFAHGANGSNVNMLLTSYDCSGNLRWARYLQDNNEYYAQGLVYDEHGGVYIAGISPGNDKYIDDSLVASDGYRPAYVVKFDTSGHLRWVKFVGEDNYNSFLGTRGYGTLAIDAKDILHYTVNLNYNMNISPTILTTVSGTYDIRYDTTGNLLNAVRLPLPDSNWYPGATVVSPQTGKIYGSFYNQISYDDSLWAFDSSGAALWTDSLQFEDFIGGLIYYDGYIYGSGRAGGYYSPHFIFAGDSVVNTSYPIGTMSVIVKLDTMGRAKWIYKNEGNYAINQLVSICAMPNGNLAATGYLAGICKHGTDSVMTASGTGQRPIVNIIDTAGNFVWLNMLDGDGFYNWGTAVASDSYGNVFIGGTVADSIYVPGGPYYVTNGGNTNFFIFKYGYNCHCTADSISSNFTYADSSGRTFHFTFAGSASADSIVWDFGDGQTSHSINPSHTFASLDSYRVCVTVYTDCGSTTTCKDILYTEKIPGLSGFANVIIYPNPVTGMLTIEGAENGTQIRVTNSLGQLIYTSTLRSGKETVQTGGWPDAVYFLQLSDTNGGQKSIPFVKR